MIFTDHQRHSRPFSHDDFKTMGHYGFRDLYKTTI